MINQMKRVKILYLSRDGSLSPCSINVPLDIENVTEYCHNDLQNMNIKYERIIIQSIEIK
jgi:hypothetical protein